MPRTFLWYDLETFGLHPQWDRVAQFGAIRTDENLDEIGPPVVLYCRPHSDCLPNPESCMVTGISPQEAAKRGLPEPEFAGQILALMSEPGTCTVGFNSVQFDDEFVRALLFRNFFDPYRREWEHGNSRWDIRSLVAMTRDLRPQGLRWPLKDDGTPDSHLESLARANGLSHDRAHDALSDVRATLDLARLIKARQGKLYVYHLGLRDKRVVREHLSLTGVEPVVHCDALHTRKNGTNTTLVLPLSVHPEYENSVLVCDLREPPETWAELSADELRERLFEKSGTIDPELRPRILEIRTNRVPAIAPLSTLGAGDAKRLGIDVEVCMRRARWLRERPDLIQRVRAAYAHGAPRVSRDVELRIYTDGFLGDGDRALCDEFRSVVPEKMLSYRGAFRDPRCAELVWRYVARNHPEVLSPDDKRRWKSQCAARILKPEPDSVLDFATYRRRVRQLLASVDTPAEDKPVLAELAEYGEHLERTVLR